MNITEKILQGKYVMNKVKSALLKYSLFIFVFMLVLAPTITYASEVQAGLVNSHIKWQEKKIKVYVEANKNSSIIKKSFLDWEKASNNLFKITFIDNKADADISVYVNSKNLSKMSACTQIYHKGGYILRSEIYLPKNLIESGDIAMISIIATHEIGHSLGIVKHSSNKNDIMFPYDLKHDQKIQPNDVNMLKSVYSEFSKSAALPARKEIKLQDYKYDLPYLADVYKQRKDFSKAIEIYNKILKQDPSSTLAMYSIGYCYFQEKNYIKAMEYLQKAYDKEPSNSVYLNSYIRVLCKTGNINTAKSVFSAYLVNNPQNTSNKIILDTKKILSDY